LLGQEIEATELIFEGDANLVVHAVIAQEPCNSSYGHIVEGIQDALKSFIRMSFDHIARDRNYAAHGLAKEAILHVMDTTWRNEIPPFIYDIVMREGSTRSL
jgi:DNA-binding FadR family transcriptional regulator